MMENPLVSVIVPCYNMERFLKRSVESLLATDYEEKEIILVNDGSSDSTRQIIDSYCSRYQCIKGVH
ncbi:MAG: glycosyltransferase [Muribaculaceae bacterium]|nr:glycosyltransferase [Muribaculaceae bacterium]